MASSAKAEAKLAELKASEAAAMADLKAAVAKLKGVEAELAAAEAKLKAVEAELAAAEAEAKLKASSADVHFNGFEAIPFEEILEYHRKRLKNPELSVEQLSEIFKNKTKMRGAKKLIEIYENKKDLDETSKRLLIRMKARFAEETKEHNKRQDDPSSSQA